MQKAMDILKEIVETNTLLEDQCILYFHSFGDFSLNISFIYKIKKESSIFEGQSTINLEILRRFNQEKLEFAFPTQTIFTHKEG
jgi:small-conductance mechanosensitive channel